jgi:hypothetical protein
MAIDRRDATGALATRDATHRDARPADRAPTERSRPTAIDYAADLIAYSSISYEGEIDTPFPSNHPGKPPPFQDDP